MEIQLQFLFPVEGLDGEQPLLKKDEDEIVPPMAILLLQVLTVEKAEKEGRDDIRS